MGLSGNPYSLSHSLRPFIKYKNDFHQTLQRFWDKTAQTLVFVFIFNIPKPNRMRLRTIHYSLFVVLSALITLISCQKEFNPELPGEPESKISSKDPVTLSKNMRVWHGVRTSGAPPAPRGTALQLDDFVAAPVKAFAGRYAIMQPTVLSGEIKGYYVALNGANEYFKVDYTKPRDIAGRVNRPDPRSASFLTPRANRTTNGNVDSSIVVVLPPNIQVPDTFCITYCAYDSLGNVSNPVTTCIIVNSLGTDANGGWINGVWKFTSSWEPGFPVDTIIHDKWIADGQEYYCDYESVTNSYFLDTWNNGTPRLAMDSIIYNKADLTLGVNGGQKYEYDFAFKLVDNTTSNCQQIFWEPVAVDIDAITGGWTFNSATNKITLIFEFDDSGIPVVEAWEYDVIKVSNNHFIMVDNYDPSFPYFMRMEK